MDAAFWIKAWNDGRTAFHQKDYNEQLTAYFARLKPAEGQKVLVPLCGKSKDLLWLEGLGLQVQGVELHSPAVEAFFAENGLSPIEKGRDLDFATYRHGAISIGCGDFFKFKGLGAFDFVYDRAALVALPAPMRTAYAAVIRRSLKKGGKCLLLTYEYDQSKMDGPPFSVDDKEVRSLYEGHFSIELVESEQSKLSGPRFEALGGLRESVYILEKKD